MGILRKAFGFLGWGAQREIFDKTLGKPLKDNSLKTAALEAINKLWWASTVLGDKSFPKLQGKRVFGKVHIGALIILSAACTIPGVLVVRAGNRLANMEWVREWNADVKERHLHYIERNKQSTENESREGKN